ncbi:hypothetical protein OIO90_000828 [Microbotryomycetes sp. JL221]|nr:hypothetical protein OIO90_000828 [Microbotryomycetes sp. JL221]
MDPFGMPLEPLLNLGDSLAYLNGSATLGDPAGAAVAAAAAASVSTAHHHHQHHAQTQQHHSRPTHQHLHHEHQRLSSHTGPYHPTVQHQQHHHAPTAQNSTFDYSDWIHQSNAYVEQSHAGPSPHSTTSLSLHHAQLPAPGSAGTAVADMASQGHARATSTPSSHYSALHHGVSHAQPHHQRQQQHHQRGQLQHSPSHPQGPVLRSHFNGPTSGAPAPHSAHSPHAGMSALFGHSGMSSPVLPAYTPGFSQLEPSSRERQHSSLSRALDVGHQQGMAEAVQPLEGGPVDMHDLAFARAKPSTATMSTRTQAASAISPQPASPIGLPSLQTRQQQQRTQRGNAKTTPDERARKNSTSAPAPATVASTTRPLRSVSKTQKAPQQDESVPEAALHLLRLALPSGSNGSVTTTVDDEERSTEDGERDTIATSVYSDDVGHHKTAFGGANFAYGAHDDSQLSSGNGRSKEAQIRYTNSETSPSQLVHPDYFQSEDMMLWRHAEDQPPLELRSGVSAAGNGSHRPRAHQVEDKSSRFVAAPRRRSSRVRKPRISTAEVLAAEGSDDSDEDGDHFKPDQEEVDAYDSEELEPPIRSAIRRPSKGKGRLKAPDSDFASGTSAALRSAPMKRLSQIQTLEGTPPPKKARSSLAGSTTGTSIDGNESVGSSVQRKGRRQPVIPDNYVDRTFPPSIPVDRKFPRFYRAFPISSAFPPDCYVHAGAAMLPEVMSAPAASGHQDGFMDALFRGENQSHVPALASSSPVFIPFGTELGAVAPAPAHAPYVNGNPNDMITAPPPDAKWNKTSDPFNLYNPRLVKGNTDAKVGLCPICIEPIERGGASEEKWLKLKNSSFVYHMSYYHGISNVTGLPFSPPVAIREVNTGVTHRDTRNVMKEGLCHECNHWIPLESKKAVDALVPELFWFKHAKKCHNTSRLAGDVNCFINDSLYRLAMARRPDHSGGR